MVCGVFDHAGKRSRPFLDKGSSKISQQYFCKKSTSNTFSKQIDKNFGVSFSSTFFVLLPFPVFLSSQRWKFKALKKHFTKKVASKSFTKNPKPKPIFFSISISFVTFLGVFRRGEFKNTTGHKKKYRVLFSDPPNRGGPGPSTRALALAACRRAPQSSAELRSPYCILSGCDDSG
jgi:hypothetical protein